MTQRVNVSTTNRSVVVADRLELAAGGSGPFTVSASVAQDYVLTELLALRPIK